MWRRALASWRSAAALVAAALVAGAWDPDAVHAHGPCGCLDPRVVEAGGRVRVVGSDFGAAAGDGYPAYRVIFNPRPADLGIAPAYLAGAFRADAPSATVLSRARTSPTRRGRFRVPRAAPPGLYMVLVFDGEEGGAHNTWEYLHVVAAGQAPPAGVVAAGGRNRRPTGQTGPSDPAPAPAPAASAEASGGSSVAWPLLLLAAGGGLAVGLVAGRRLRGPTG